MIRNTKNPISEYLKKAFSVIDDALNPIVENPINMY